MSIIIDLIVIAIIALFTFLGYKQGLVKAAIKILSFFIAIIIAFVIYKPVSNIIIKNTTIDDNIRNIIIEKIKPEGVDENQEVIIDEKINNKIIQEAGNTVAEIANTFSIKLIEISTLIILFIICKIILKFVSALTNIITKLPILNQVNKLRTEQYMDL